MADFDVLIAGAGPAGCACAISLADFAPELTVCLADAPPRDTLRIGETVPPQVRPILEHLGLWSRFASDRHCASYRTVSAWGSPHLLGNEFLFQTQQVGWRLDRVRFDAMMLQAAVARVAAHRPMRIVDVTFADNVWRLPDRDGACVTARFAIDATGRAAALARSQGLRPVIRDRLVGCVMQFEGAADDGEGLLIESSPHGWWYSAAIPDQRRIVALMSDADLIRSRGAVSLDGWMQALAETRHVRLTASGARPVGSPKLVPAGSRHLADRTALPLICAGDAASSFDPISGQGIIKALRSGIFASYATADYLCRGDQNGLARYDSFVRAEFSDYWQVRREYYALERRWPDRPFWQRRHADDSRRQEPVPATLAPAHAALA